MKKSFIPVEATSHFSLQNIPFGVFSVRGEAPCPRWRVGTAIGEFVLDLALLEEEGLLEQAVPSLTGQGGVFAQGSLNKFMSMGRAVWREVRSAVIDLLSEGNPRLRDDADLRAKSLIPMADVEMSLPARIGDYTDFFVSKHHALNCSEMLRNTRKILDNWYHLPVGYHGRASSIVASGTDIRRPRGQFSGGENGRPVEGPCQRLDYELEMACFVGPGNSMGESIPVDKAEEHIFGMVLMNDWSARDIQKWEGQPLGPFNGKNFATSVSPWVVTLDALEPFRCEAPELEAPVLPYLDQKEHRTNYDIQLEVSITPDGHPEGFTVCRSNYKHMYWTLPTFVAHHSHGGCNLQPGDLMGTGTISGPTEDSFGCLLEKSWGGTKEFALGNGGLRRTFLEDGDTVTMSGFCQGDGFRVGFGECVGKVLPARAQP